MITKDNKNVSIMAITPENYLVPAGEERLYHVKLEVKSFDHRSGERLSHPFIQKFSRIDFENGRMSMLRQQGYDIVILHDPKVWMEEHAAELQAAKLDRAERAKAKAEAEREEMKAALREELKQELLAEMKEEKSSASKSKSKKEKEKEPVVEEPKISTDPDEPDLS